MGGRGGSGPNTGAQGGTDLAANFREWANGERPIHVDYVGEGRVQVLLPDHSAYLSREGGTYIIRDITTDERLFSNTHGFKGLWNEVSSFYGGRVQVSVDPQETAPRYYKLGLYGVEHGRKTSPAARKYRVK